MGRSRRARRRVERQRARRPARGRALSLFARLGLLALGLLSIGGGIALLTAGGPGTATRLGRVAGILIVIGSVAVIAAAIGRI